MEEGLSRTLRTVIAAVLVAGGAAGAQPAGDAGLPPSGAVYDLTQGGVRLGESTVDVMETTEGFLSRSRVDLPGIASLEDELVAGPDGAARSYAVTGTVQGVAIDMRVEFGPEGAAVRLTQAGRESTFTLPSDEPLHVVDNNFLDGLQVLVSVALREPAEPLDVAIVVPLAGAVGRLSLAARAGAETVDLAGGSVEARVLDAALTVGPQTLDYVLWADDQGRILALELAAAGVRYELRDAATGAPEDGAAAGETAAAFLERTAACVETRALRVESAGETLYGELTLPVGAPAAGAPTLLLLPGSGAVDVEGNAPPVITNSGYRQLAQALGCAGYGVLRVAKMGIPPSTGDANAATLPSYAADVAAWFNALAAEEVVDASRLGLMGHSEGGLVALYAVAEGYVAPDALVLIATAGRPLAVLLEEQVVASARRAGMSGEALEAYARDVAELLDAVRRGTGQALEVTDELADNDLVPLFAHAAGLLRSEIDVDPAALAARVEAPTLVLQGLKDVQVLQVDGQLLAEALPRATHLELPDLTHDMVDTGLPAEQKLYPAPTDVVSQTLVASLATFLNGTLKLAR